MPFGVLTMNHHAPHINGNCAANSPFVKLVVVVCLVYNLAFGLSVPDVSGKAIANLEVEEIKHLAPTFHGDTIYAETTVLDKRESRSQPDRGIITVETRAYKQTGEQVLSFRRKVMVPKKPAAE